MEYWQGVVSRISVPGIILIVLGAVLCFGAQKLAPMLFKDEQKILPMKMTGLILVIAGALIALI
ncbi:MAG TPA: hypothetical protein PK537_02420 [Candidatus Limiplasma sp.]|nr:hypothetical protein [Candidatus Limiplasma sp.]